MCGEPLKKGSTACSCGYKESLADRELLRRLARWDRMRTVCSVMLVLGFAAGGVVWWRSGDIRWGLLALFILLAVGIIGLCRCDSRQRKLIWEQMGDFFRSETEQAFGPGTRLPDSCGSVNISSQAMLPNAVESVSSFCATAISADSPSSGNSNFL